MRPFEIYFAQVPWKGCLDERPWLIVEVLPGGALGAFPISSQSYGDSCFPLDATHPDFPATGLARSCFVHDGSIIELRPEWLRRRKGELTGALLAEFRRYSGV